MFNISKILSKTLTFSSVVKVSSRNFTPRRALLYVPGDDLRKLTKAFDLDVDFIVMDCEDGVAVSKKNQARSIIRDVLDAGKPERNRKYDLGVRINAMDTGLFEDDLSEVLEGKTLPDTLLLPKVNSIDHLKLFSEELDKHKQIGTDKKINLIIYIESARALINIVDIVEAAFELGMRKSKFSLKALVFGSDDFCASIGATRTEDSTEILYARQKIVVVAKAFNLQAIDMVHINYKDLAGLKRQSEEGARMGYTGKQVIHPDQVPVVQEAFLPGKERVKWATELIQAFEKHQETGKGAFTYKGSMIDMPTVKQALNVMDLVISIKPTKKTED